MCTTAAIVFNAAQQQSAGCPSFVSRVHPAVVTLMSYGGLGGGCWGDCSRLAGRSSSSLPHFHSFEHNTTVQGNEAEV